MIEKEGIDGINLCNNRKKISVFVALVVQYTKSKIEGNHAQEWSLS